MTNLEEKSYKVQLDLANEIILAQENFISHLRIEAGMLLERDGKIKDPEKTADFLEKLKDRQKNSNISSLCADYLRESQMKLSILHKFN